MQNLNFHLVLHFTNDCRVDIGQISLLVKCKAKSVEREASLQTVRSSLYASRSHGTHHLSDSIISNPTTNSEMDHLVNPFPKSLSFPEL